MNAKRSPWQSECWNLAELLSEAGVVCADATPGNVIIKSLCEDSRAVVPGSLFIAIDGEQASGHDYIECAVNAGASAVVAQRKVNLTQSVPQIIVADTHEAVANLASAFYHLRKRTNPESGPSNRSRVITAPQACLEPRALAGTVPPNAKASEPAIMQQSHHAEPDQPAAIKLIGVTGTNGKTTVAWLVRAILRHANQKCALLGTIEYDLGDRTMVAPLTTPGSIVLCKHLARARQAGVSHAILEVSSHALNQQRTAGLSFDVGVFTNLSGDHLDYHGSMDAYWRAKRRLFASLSDSAVAIVNYDDPAADLMVSGTRARVVRYGLAASNLDVSAKMGRSTIAGSRFRLSIGQACCDVKTTLLGKHNMANAAAAAAVADAMGVPLELTQEALSTYGGTPGRLERVSHVDSDFAVFVDYAHTDDALRHVLAAVKPLTSGRLICLFGCGGDRDTSKRPRMAQVASSMADVVIVTSDNPRTEDPMAIINDILVGFDSAQKRNVEIEPDRRLAIDMAIGLAMPGDTVLIAGKGHENYQLVGDKVLEFDDAIVARNHLKQRVAGLILP